ncbi:MAG: lecithin retinol acyltransferase family protein [Oscillospiraceae bacterium]|nr:lecithin retinol acyltransferase family protein [Oscillospiraceae bacterium]
MAILDAFARGLDKLADKIDRISDSQQLNQDTEFSIMDKDYCWEDLDYAGDATMQRHVVTGQCRIVGKYGTVLDRGTQEEMEQSMIRRTAMEAALHKSTGSVYPSEPDSRVEILKAVPDPVYQTPVLAQYGDIIGVVRGKGTYEHYGIYVSDTCVVHYGIPSGKTLRPSIHATSLRHFLGSDTEYFVLDFPKPYQPPIRLGNQGSVPHSETVSEELAKQLYQTYGYHLYTPEETVARARSRIGETSYNLLTNNCEHFAIWCKTGVSESIQVSGMLQTLLKSTRWSFRKPVYR